MERINDPLYNRAVRNLNYIVFDNFIEENDLNRNFKFYAFAFNEWRFITKAIYKVHLRCY